MREAHACLVTREPKAARGEGRARHCPASSRSRDRSARRSRTPAASSKRSVRHQFVQHTFEANDLVTHRIGRRDPCAGSCPGAPQGRHLPAPRPTAARRRPGSTRGNPPSRLLEISQRRAAHGAYPVLLRPPGGSERLSRAPSFRLSDGAPQGPPRPRRCLRSRRRGSPRSQWHKRVCVTSPSCTRRRWMTAPSSPHISHAAEASASMCKPGESSANTRSPPCGPCRSNGRLFRHVTEGFIGRPRAWE